MKKALSFRSCNVNVGSTSYKLHLFVLGVLNLKPGTTLLRALIIERGEFTYTYLDKSVVAHVAAHLVRACKFCMKQAPYMLERWGSSLQDIFRSSRGRTTISCTTVGK